MFFDYSQQMRQNLTLWMDMLTPKFSEIQNFSIFKEFLNEKKMFFKIFKFYL